jgi:hypothetical protein
MITVKVVYCRSSALKACKNESKYCDFDAEGGYKSGERSVGMTSRVGIDVVARCKLTLWSMLANGELDDDVVGSRNVIGVLLGSGESLFVRSKA